jgi:putative addiction module component (TIGR02574 family)
MTQPAPLSSLPVADRLRLIEELWDSIDAEALPLPEWQREEVERRLDAIRADGGSGSPWSEVRARITRQA